MLEHTNGLLLPSPDQQFDWETVVGGILHINIEIRIYFSNKTIYLLNSIQIYHSITYVCSKRNVT
jgi:hypothetical protein